MLTSIASGCAACFAVAIVAESKKLGAENGTTFSFAETNVNIPAPTDPRIRAVIAQSARELGLSASTLTNELAAARREFRRLVLDVLREQCETDEEFEAERRTLIG
jgi:hypothetical protein